MCACGCRLTLPIHANHTTPAPVMANIQLLHEAGHVRRTWVHAAAGQRILQLVGLRTQETYLRERPGNEARSYWLHAPVALR